jgi:hypothetical protein
MHISIRGALIRMLGISIALAIFLAGCGGSQPDGGIRTPTSQLPTTITSPTPVPTVGPLPADIVVYPGAKLVVSQRITTGILYFYQSMASINAVTSFYMDQMPRQGWNQASVDLSPQGNFLVYTKDTRSVQINIVADLTTPAQTDITITLSNS